ncbi:YceK/YidQ family lipoprotein [Pseudomonas sp. P39-UII1]|uniref:YceK/YidQ family lipoprotein n=1 Tax=Pseudomonas sp. P39-UII1 TaxID=3080333 RepID=UPI0032081E4A
MMRWIARGLVLALALMLSGCWSLLTHLDGERCVYPGTRFGWNFAIRNEGAWIGLVDVPFSLALDTVLLPYDLSAFFPDGMGGGDRECNLDGKINVM